MAPRKEERKNQKKRKKNMGNGGMVINSKKTLDQVDN